LKWSLKKKRLGLEVRKQNELLHKTPQKVIDRVELAELVDDEKEEHIYVVEDDKDKEEDGEEYEYKELLDYTTS
jgi:hypothetical protein